MSELRIAFRYAKSLLDLSIEKGNLEQVHADMQLFSSVCEANRDFVLLLRNPIVSHQKKLGVLENVFKSKVDDMTLQFFRIITIKGREMYLPQVALGFHQQYNSYKGIEHAIITTSIPLNETIKAEVVKLVKEVSNKEVELEERLDENLIGGFILRVGDKQIDESIQSKLRLLRQQMTSNTYIKTF